MTNETTNNFTIEVSEEHWEFTKEKCSCVLNQLEMELNYN